jgi:hypothetical protein
MSDNTKSALEELLVSIHTEVAETMLEDLRDPDKRSPQLYGQIIKFLKDNGIDLLYCNKDKGKSAFGALMEEVQEQMENYQ